MKGVSEFTDQFLEMIYCLLAGRLGGNICDELKKTIKTINCLFTDGEFIYLYILLKR